jgi:hypothetical protein
VVVFWGELLRCRRELRLAGDTDVAREDPES